MFKAVSAFIQHFYGSVTFLRCVTHIWSLYNIWTLYFLWDGTG